jgi:succinate-semialdehyde dehydrogenase / glutarate-semialdehyde dehydrogenase
MAIATTNPATGEILRHFEEISDEELESCLARAVVASREQRLTTFEQRSAWMRQAADLLDADNETVARIMTTEMGKTVKSARGEVAKCARGCRYYAEHAAALLADEPADAAAVGAEAAYARYEPLGVVLAVMPWNFPLWQVVRFAAPALMAGNVGLLKHASNVPQTALAIEDLFRRAGLPDGVFTNLFVPSSQVAELIHDPRIVAVTLTGSEPAGMSVAAAAGDALKKTVL